MALSEFDLIERFFVRKNRRNPSVRLGIGDDCALLGFDDLVELAVTTDTMVEGVHFFSSADPQAVGYKALAVNLSDLASMGAEPVCATLALTMPESDASWLSRFAQGFFDLAQEWSVELIGGDTTQGPLTITVQAMGTVPKGEALLRSTARPADLIYVTGYLGDAGLGVKIEQNEVDCSDAAVLNRLHRPEPRVEAGLRLRGVATSCIDLSDGLAGDLGHILQASGVGAIIDWDKLPLSDAVRHYIGESRDWELPLRGGDDYELCFTIPASEAAAMERRMADLRYPCACVGVIDRSDGLRVLKDSNRIQFSLQGYEHFS
jgi:thiamine-monophosphate kinase